MGADRDQVTRLRSPYEMLRLPPQLAFLASCPSANEGGQVRPVKHLLYALAALLKVLRALSLAPLLEELVGLRVHLEEAVDNLRQVAALCLRKITLARLRLFVRLAASSKRASCSSVAITTLATIWSASSTW